MGVTTRGGARACVVDTGSTATRANAPPARGAAHTGAEREARGVVRDKQRRGLEVAEGPGATGATALLRDRGAKRSADAAPLGAEAASNARRRAGEAVTDVTSLPDDVLEVVFGHLARDASPGQYFNAMLTSKRFRDAGMSKRALSDVGEKVLSKATAENWNEGASAFAEAAVDAGSVFATFLVGSVDFYCRDSTLESDEQCAKARRSRGASLLARAAVAGSPDAHHTLAIMHFNGSGGKRKDKDPETGAAFCARGNILFGSAAAKRELGHCLQDGFGVEQDVQLGRKLLAEAAKADVTTPAMDTAVVAATVAAGAVEERLRKRNDINTLNAAVAAAAEVSAAAKHAAEQHLTAPPVARFLLDWYDPEVCGNVLQPGTHACSHPLCGRVETRRHEFRRCSCCGRVRYCSRSCQSLDWRLQHKFACLPLLELYGWIESDTESQDTTNQAFGDEAELALASGASSNDLTADLPVEAQAAR